MDFERFVLDFPYLYNWGNVELVDIFRRTSINEAAMTDSKERGEQRSGRRCDYCGEFKRLTMVEKLGSIRCKECDGSTVSNTGLVSNERDR